MRISDWSSDVCSSDLAAAPAWQWQVGDSHIDFLLSSKRLFTLDHQASRGGVGRWEIQGAIARLPVSPQLIADRREKFDTAFEQTEHKAGVRTTADQVRDFATILLLMEIGRPS